MTDAATPQQRTEAMRKALVTIIAEKVEATNAAVRERMTSGTAPDESFNALMFDAGGNVGLLTQALGRVLLFDELYACVDLLVTAPLPAPVVERTRRLLDRARREGA